MKTAWILPDRQQTGMVFIDWGSNIEPLHKSLDLGRLPKAFTLGIPEEVASSDLAANAVFSQFARLEGGSSLFAASLVAGNDNGGRTVVLTLLVTLQQNDVLNQLNDLDIQLPMSEKKHGEKLLNILADDFRSRDSSLSFMLKAVERFPRFNTFASDYLSRSVNPPDWMKKKVFGKDS